ncbi:MULTISPECIES: hypothetical protein [unclassified Nostoc]|uniref:hypothetical protein n=1 Tax=unclassified Nostoc TaxID=2593658 RepID=UPI0025DB922E|nr:MULTISPECIES: hypothetical protein [unclassified Nostoc]MBN3989237.1 hypothetical protein [Nostoc sp. NMS2]
MVCHSWLTPHSLETVGRVLWTQPATVATMPPFRLPPQVARAIVARSQLRFIRRLLSLYFWQR